MTKPGGALLFPQLAKPTGKLTLPADLPAGHPGKGVMMPKRLRTRAQDRQARIDYERALNHRDYLLRPRPEAEPPPF